MLNPALVRHDPAATSRLLLTLLAVPCLYLLLMKVRPEETA